MKDISYSVSNEGTNGKSSNAGRSADLRQVVDEVVGTTSIFDLHTHLFAPQFRGMNLWGIDELLNYHYLVAELFRSSNVQPIDFWRLERNVQADLIWKTLFVENTPLSEATRGVIRVLSTLGLNTSATDLSEARAFFADQNENDYIDRVLELSGVQRIGMTNDPLDSNEIEVWNSGEGIDKRFHAALRLDRLLNDWTDAAVKIAAQDYNVTEVLDDRTKRETRRFLDDWIRKMDPLYLGVSLPDDFVYPNDSPRGQLLRDVVIPACREHQLSLALMIGVRRRVNPALKLAGAGLGRADVNVVSHICTENPDVRFLATFLSRENQHELCVVARKFPNLMPFGCWWFLNNPSIISEITRERLELLGTSFIPQHSDARILDQLIYKWSHFRRDAAEALFEAYTRLQLDGRTVSRQDIERDVTKLFSGNFCEWVGFSESDR